MLRFRLALSVVLALAVVAFAGSFARADVCAVGYPLHARASVWLHHHKLAQCGGGTGCKCVSCYGWSGGVYSVCYPTW
jgi:hypothetical protein